MPPSREPGYPPGAGRTPAHRDHRYPPPAAPVGGRAWSDVGGAAWNDPDAPTQVQPRYRDPRPPGPPRGPLPPGRGYPPEPPRRRRTSALVIVGRIISGILALALVAGSGFIWALFGGKPSNASDAPSNAGNVGVVTQTTDAAGKTVTAPIQGTNILIIGADSRTDANGNPLSPAELAAVNSGPSEGGINTDTIILLHIPDGGGRATAISIPRDTWIPDSVVHAPGVVGPYADGTQGPYKANKVNSFYGSAKAYETQYLVGKGVTDKAAIERQSNEAGRTMLIKVLQQFTGWKIDHFAEVNLIGFYLLSKAIGGVPVCLLKPVKDHFSGADFPAGHFEVEGSQALAFVRQRHGLPNGDLDRVRRQQVFLASAANKILSVGTLTSPSKLSALVDAANRSLVLDSGFNLLTFGQQMIGLTSGNITFATMPTDGSQSGVGTDALATDPAKIRAFFAGIAAAAASTSTTAPSSTAPTSASRGSVTVDVQNGTTTVGLATAVGDFVAGAGFARGQMTNFPGTTSSNQQAHTTVRYPAGGETAARDVLSVLKVGTLAEDDAVPAGHVLVVLGTDMPRPSLITGSSAAPTTSPTTSAKPTASTGASASTSTALPSGAISAADPGCVN